MPDLTMNQTDMELVCLELMANGEDLLSLGVWESVVKRLMMREEAVLVGNGYRITEKGRARFAKSEGVDFETVKALEPPRPNWIIAPLPDDGGLVILRKNDLVVSGYEALAARWVPIVHGQTNEFGTVAVQDDADGFLQASLDAAWAKGLRPTVEEENV